MFSLFTQEKSIRQEWKPLTSTQQLEEVLVESITKPVVLFKHSTSCSRSALAKNKLESDYAFGENDLSFYYLDLLAHRDVSNAIEAELGIRHQSPQILVIKNKKVVFHTSHESISIEGIAKSIR
jgi:bacillithiol system protein YtxJ